MPSLRVLAPHFRQVAQKFFRDSRRRYPGLVITSSRRTYQEQLRLYQRAQAGQNDGLPATPPGSSSHETGLAFDMARLNHPAIGDPVLVELGAIWNTIGNRYGHGYWWAGDPVHFAWKPANVSGRKKKRSRR